MLKPFNLRVVTDKDEISDSIDYMNRGFHLKYHQMSCNNQSGWNKIRGLWWKNWSSEQLCDDVIMAILTYLFIYLNDVSFKLYSAGDNDEYKIYLKSKSKHSKFFFTCHCHVAYFFS